MNTKKTCSKCHAALASDAPDGLCPACLLEAGLSTELRTETCISDANTTSHATIEPGKTFGNYCILKELGRGGMGSVYEGEDLQSGRRIALKVLNHQIDSSRMRARFLREGRLAASVNHPNSVYIFGSEEIDNIPTISMEIITGRTLRERVQTDGPMRIKEAVDATIQIIAGLKAAHTAGILHRDIKPSNCFEDRNGNVKIGDFGLSISTEPRDDLDITQPGSFLGTPSFSSPEQLRGEELNLRSDLYSVGATLFFLLTGRPPFDGKNITQVIANTLEQRVPNPTEYRADIPSPLVDVIRRCLAKIPTERYDSYEALHTALLPFSSMTPEPASLGRRMLAGMVDNIFLGVVNSAVILITFLLGKVFSLTPENLSRFGTPGVLLGATSAVMLLLYYGFLEGIRGASIGKLICRIRVILPDCNPPGILKSMYRAFTINIIALLPCWILSFALTTSDGFFPESIRTWAILTTLSPYLLLGLIFSTARRRNGFAGVHDLLTGTRVTMKPTPARIREPLPTVPESSLVTDDSQRIGPYHVIAELGKDAEAQWFNGFDSRLLRKVLLRVVPDGTPCVSSNSSNLDRPTRLRWIAGRRSPGDNWDAYENLSGQPLLDLIKQPQPWSKLRFWLLDLASELDAAEKDGSLPSVIALDRVWITNESRAKLLDFPAPGMEHMTDSRAFVNQSDSRQFLADLAEAAMTGDMSEHTSHQPAPSRQPLPLHARRFLDQLPSLPDTGTVIRNLKPLMEKATIVSRQRRAGIVACSIAFPLFFAVMGAGASILITNIRSSQPEITRLASVLKHRSALREAYPDDHGLYPERVYSVYIAANFAQIVTNNSIRNKAWTRNLIRPDERRFAEQSVTASLNPTESEIREAAQLIEPCLPDTDKDGNKKTEQLSLMVLGMFTLLTFFYVCIPAILAALLFRGGLIMKALKVAVVTKDGTQATRLRVVLRALIAWSPVMLPCLAVLLIDQMPLDRLLGYGNMSPAAVIGIALTLISLMLPHRSLQDRLAGTWLVPR